MKSQPMNASSEFVFAKMHGRWAASFTEDKIARLIHAGSTHVLGRDLAAWNVDVDDRTRVQQQLNAHLIEELAGIRRFLHEGDAHFYSLFLDKYFFENLKTILHYRYAPEPEETIHALLVSSGELPEFDVEGLLAASSLHQFNRRLPEHPVKPELLPILVELDGTHDLFVSDSKLDILFYRSFLQAARGVGTTVRSTAEELVRTEIDIANSIVFLRNSAIYRLRSDVIRELIIPDGLLIGPVELARLLASQDPADVQKALPGQYARILEKSVDEPLYMCENRLWTLLYKKACDAFNDFDCPARAIPAFGFMKRAEHLNLGRVFEGLYLQLEPRIIETMIIGASGV